MLPSRKPVLRTPVLRRQSIYRIIGEAKNEAKAEAMAEAKAEAKAEAAKAKAEAKWSSTGASVGSRGLGPSQARCATLVRLLLLFDPDYWCSGTERGLRQLPELCSAHGGVAGLEQRGVEQRESPRGLAGGGRRRPGASLWCGCCSSPTPVLGAAAPGSI